VAYPALREFGLPASVFLTTAFVDNREYLWTDRVEFAVDRAAASVVDLEVGTTALSLDLRTTAGKRAAESRLRGLLKSMPQESRPGALEAIERATGGTLLDAAGGTSLYDPLTWDEAAEMARAGLVSIGSHTHTHVIIARCDPARAAEELRTSKRIIEGRLGMPCTLFCYPNGRNGDFNAATGAELRAQGYSSALTTVYGANGRDADVYALKRYNLGKPMIPGELEVRLSGLFDARSLVARR
jgi:peptidoglycan/xylan/chitin deacetylase (PgdA/CDA1 family)